MLRAGSRNPNGLALQIGPAVLSCKPPTDSIGLVFFPGCQTARLQPVQHNKNPHHRDAAVSGLATVGGGTTAARGCRNGPARGRPRLRRDVALATDASVRLRPRAGHMFALAACESPEPRRHVNNNRFHEILLRIFIGTGFGGPGVKGGKKKETKNEHPFF